MDNSNDQENFSAVVTAPTISKLVRRKDINLLNDCGGLEGIVSTLQTDTETGIHGDPNDIDERTKILGSNLFPNHNLVCGFGNFVLESMKDLMIQLLLVCSLLSLGFGIHQAHAHENPFLSSGATVVKGYAKMVVTAVGKSMVQHAICLMGRLFDEMEKLMVAMDKIVQAVAWVSFLVLLWEFFDKEENVWAVMVRIVATPLMIALSSKAVKIGFAYSMEAMMRIN